MKPFSGMPVKMTPNPSAPHWADQLFRLYPSLASTALTPEFVVGVREMLGRYPENVLASVCSPTTGIATKTTFFPSLAELKKSLDEAAEPDLAAMRGEQIIRTQLAERRIQENIGEDRQNRPSLAEMKDQYGENWGLKPEYSMVDKPPPKPAPPWSDVVAFYQARQGRITELADALKKLRGEKTNQ